MLDLVIDGFALIGLIASARFLNRLRPCRREPRP